ncbi:MAG: M1 family metallopeptidase [Thermoplasmata archaeon]|nr:M1 family metallopeptidase [Thermoplasmata archaeon]
MHSTDPPRISEYRLHLDVDFDRATWRGFVEIPSPLPTTGLDLDVEDLWVVSVRRGARALDFFQAPDQGRLSIPSVGEGPDPLLVEFHGEVRPKGLLGLYRCRHGADFVLTTQCEPIGARRIFPCLDRPDRKSRLHLTVRTRADLEVIGNSAGTPSAEHDGVRDWSFEPTPPMASYLFYLGIGRFDRVEDRTGRVAVRVLTPPGRAADGAYALDAARRIVAGCEEYYAIPYPLSKIDLVAVSEHAFGAMENWGALSFREVRLLIDARSTTFARRDVFETIAHEIAHQWFGDLVTMDSWDDVWLNESFASFVETRITERLAPELDARTDSFLRVAGTTAAFDGDSLPSTHPVRTHVDRPEEINQVFDEITYGKGCAVLGMIEGYLGEERFRAGVTEYLRRFRFGNAQTADLWDALGQVSGEAVSQMISPWIDRPGHPVIHVRTDAGGLTLRQDRFSLLGTPSEDPWLIPMLFDVNGTTQRVVFDSREMVLPTPERATVILNPGAVGFYRVRYDAPMYDRLFAALPSRSPADRWAVVEDLAAFLVSGEIDWPLYERAVRILGATTDRLVVESFSATLLQLGLMYPAASAVQGVARGFFADRLAAIGGSAVPDENPTHGILRERLSLARARLDLGFARDLTELFPEWERLDPNVRGAVAVARARADGASGWAELRRVLDLQPPEAERTQLERGLAWSSDPDRVAATLGLLDSGAIVRSHIVATLVQVAANPVGRPLLWPWFRDHLPVLGEQLRGSSSFGMMLESVVPMIGLGRGEEIRTFFRDHPLPEGSRGIAKGLQRLEVYERLAGRLD